LNEDYISALLTYVLKRFQQSAVNARRWLQMRARYCNAIIPAFTKQEKLQQLVYQQKIRDLDICKKC